MHRSNHSHSANSLIIRNEILGASNSSPLFYPRSVNQMVDQVKKKLLLLLGFISLGLGFVGVFLPLWPTTPFVLLSAWMFAKSSDKYHRWLRQNRFFGDALRGWEAGEGLTLRVKWRMVILATVFIGSSVVLCPSTIGRIILLLIWLIPLSVAIITKTRR